MATSSNHDAVKYSLLDDQDNTSSANAEGDNFHVTTMTRPVSSGPSRVNMFAGRLRGNQRITFLAVLLTSFLIIIWLLSHMDSTTEATNSATQRIQPDYYAKPSTVFKVDSALGPDGSLRASDLKVDQEKEDAFKLCYTNKSGERLGRSITDIYKKIKLMKASNIEKCKKIWRIFDNIIRMDKVDARLVLPEPFQIEVRRWLNNSDELFQQVNNQVVYKVVDKGTYEETVINPIRSRRPQSKPDIDPIVYIKNLTESTRPTCDFCKYKDHTAEDTFGRIDNKLSASSSNTFKLAEFHALFFPKQHYPLNLTLDQLKDIFLFTSKQWFEKVFSIDPSQKFPSLMWDCLPHAGASQVHPHLHGILDSHQYAGRLESMHQVSLQYYNKLGRSYWSDFVKVHFALGLAASRGNAVVLTPLTARKDHEFMILSPSLNEDVVSLIHTVLQTYQNRLSVYCFSGAGVYPKMGDDKGEEDVGGMPVLFRFGSRGTCSAVGSDVSSLELYSINNINSDLSATFNGLKAEMTK